MASMGWTNQSTMALIELYRSKRLLWDSQHDEYYSKIAKNEAWEDIAKELETTPEECKRKMISLLASLRREKVKMRKCHLAGKKRFRSSWFAFNSLSWLLDRDNDRSGGITLPTTNISGLIKEVRGENENGEQLNNYTTEIPQHSYTNVPRITLKKRKRTQETYSVPDNFNISTDQSIDEECKTYGSFIGSKLKNYPSQTRSAVQYAISNILFKADLGRLQNYPQNFGLQDDFTNLEPLNDGSMPNFYSVLLNQNSEVKQEPQTVLSDDSSPTHVE